MDGDDGEELIADGIELQIGEEGRTFLGQSLECLSDDSVVPFLKQFSRQHSLRRRGIAPVVSLLEMGGVPLHAIHLEVLKCLTDELLRLVKAAADSSDKDRIASMFSSTFRFLTVDQLQPVAIAVLEKVDEGIVGSEHWQQVVDAGLTSKPYVDLPLSLKRRIWELHTEAFEFEVDSVLKEVKEYKLFCDMGELMDAKFYSQSHDYTALICRLVDLTVNRSTTGVELIAERFLDAARREVLDSRRVATANLFQEYFSNNDIAVRCQEHATLRWISTAARLLSARATDESAAPFQLQEIHLFYSWATSDVDKRASVIEMLALLLHSHQARDLFANQLTMTLFKYRGSFTSESIHANSTIKELTLLLLWTIRAGDIMNSGKPLTDDDVRPIFESFYPLLLREMRLDQERQSTAFDACIPLPDQRLRESMGQGCFQRRVFCTYAYLLFSLNFIIGVARFRLVLDSAYAHSAERGEEREQILARGLIVIACEDS